MKRFVIALIKHETNTFSPIATPLASFGHGEGPAFGEAARARFAGTNTPIAAYLDLARREGAEVVTPVAAESWPSNKASRATFETLVRPLEDAVRARLRRRAPRPARRDGDRGLRRRRRRDRAAPAPHRARAADRRHARLPHEPVAGRLVENATVITGYKTYPHVDMYEAGMLAGGILVGALDGDVEPVMAWGWKPLSPRSCATRRRTGRPATSSRSRGAWSRRHACSPRRCCRRSRTRTRRTPACSAVVSAMRATAGAKAARAGGLRRTCSRSRGSAATSTCSARRRSRIRSRARKALGLANPRRAGAADRPLRQLRLRRRAGRDDGRRRDPAAGASTTSRSRRSATREAVATMVDAGVGAARAPRARAARPTCRRSALKGRRSRSKAASPRSPTASSSSPARCTPASSHYLGRTAVLSTPAARADRRHRAARTSRSTSACSRHAGIDPRGSATSCSSRASTTAPASSRSPRHIVECAGAGVTNADLSVYPYRKLTRPIFPLDPM